MGSTSASVSAPDLAEAEKERRGLVHVAAPGAMSLGDKVEVILTSLGGKGGETFSGDATGPTLYGVEDLAIFCTIQ